MRSGAVLCALGAVGVVFAGSASAHAGGGHTESGDAGDGIGGAYQIAGVTPGSPLTSIAGSTSSQQDDFVDAYLIRITDPDTFHATTINNTTFDTMLYLFDMDGNALLANDDVSGSVTRSTVTNASDDGTGVVLGVGTYMLAVTGFQMDPADILGQLQFDIPIGNVTEVSGPDGVGGGGVLAEWQDNTVLGGAATGNYRIEMQGVSVVPTPGVVGIAGVAGLGIGSRRRKR